MKKGILLSLVTLFLCLTAIAGPRDKKKATDRREVDEFTKIENNSSCNITYNQQSQIYVVRVIGALNDVDKVLTRVEHGVLKISVRSGERLKGAVTVDITSPHLEQYDGLDSGNFTAQTIMSLVNAVFNLKGSGNVTLPDVDFKQLKVNVQGSGNVNIKDAHGTDMEVHNSGSGNVKGTVETDRYRGDASSSGSIKMKGSSSDFETQQTGSGKSTFNGKGKR